MEPKYSPKETISRFEKLLAELAAREVDFAVVGGLAVILNGYPRAELSVDITSQRKSRQHSGNCWSASTDGAKDSRGN